MLYRWRRVLWGITVTLAMAGIVYLARSTPRATSTVTETTVPMKTQLDTTGRFTEALLGRFPSNSTIILALVDTSFVDMALNFYITSLLRYEIDNYLFVGATYQACLELSRRHLPCVVYTNIETGDKPSLFGSPDFIRKMNIRTEMILDALFLGYTVIHTDLDVVFLRNPMPLLASTSSDLTALWDDSVYNAGFLQVRPTPEAIWIYQRTRQITQASDTTDDQSALNTAIGECVYHVPPCTVTSLPVESFVCGLHYFEKIQRMFAGQNPCMECAVVHNNWIVSKEAKVYRFKEHLMWWNDEGGYYSSTDRRYLTYSNPSDKPLGNRFLDVDTLALKYALLFGHLLNRIVILPRFHCPDNDIEMCPLNSLYNMQSFDSVFSGAYRENSFLQHPLVPNSVKNSRASVPIGNITPRRPNNRAHLPRTTATELLRRLTDEKAHVLDLGNVGDEYSKLISIIKLAPLKSKFKKALEVSNYRQYR